MTRQRRRRRRRLDLEILIGKIVGTVVLDAGEPVLRCISGEPLLDCEELLIALDVGPGGGNVDVVVVPAVVVIAKI